MAGSFTYAEVAAHSSLKDIYVVIHEKVFDITKFIDEHPGGEEVLLDVGGKDATDAFEDVGHSPDALAILTGLQIGVLNKQGGPAAAAKAQTVTMTKAPPAAGLGALLYVYILLGVAVAFGAYKLLL